MKKKKPADQKKSKSSSQQQDYSLSKETTGRIQIALYLLIFEYLLDIILDDVERKISDECDIRRFFGNRIATAALCSIS
jgi:hypothetical protein